MSIYCPRCAHPTYSSQYGLCQFCGIRQQEFVILSNLSSVLMRKKLTITSDGLHSLLLPQSMQSAAATATASERTVDLQSSSGADMDNVVSAGLLSSLHHALDSPPSLEDAAAESLTSWVDAELLLPTVEDEAPTKQRRKVRKRGGGGPIRRVRRKQYSRPVEVEKNFTALSTMFGLNGSYYDSMRIRHT